MPGRRSVSIHGAQPSAPGPQPLVVEQCVYYWSLLLTLPCTRSEMKRLRN